MNRTRAISYHTAENDLRIIASPNALTVNDVKLDPDNYTNWLHAIHDLDALIADLDGFREFLADQAEAAIDRTAARAS